MTLSRRHKIVIGMAVVLIGGGIYAVAESTLTSQASLQKFGDARAQGAVVADAIVGLSNRFGSDLGAIHQLDQEHAYADALVKTNELLARSEEMRTKAKELSDSLGTMTQTLQVLQPVEARQAALDSIAQRLILIDHLIRYSESLRELVGVLQARFTGSQISDANVRLLVDQVNVEVAAINNLNKNAVASMDRFDQLTKNR